MVKILARVINANLNTNAVVLDAVESTHGRPGFQTPDRRVISRNGRFFF